MSQAVLARLRSAAVRGMGKVWGMRYGRRLAAVIVTVLLLASTAACGESNVAQETPAGPTIAIGVAEDEPGLSWFNDGHYSGFDITVARYVAKSLGYADKQIDFKSVTPHNGTQLLEQGKADLVVSALPMAATALAAIEYAGPYLVANQELLIHSEEKSTLTSSKALTGKTVCTAMGSGAEANLLKAIPGVIVKPRGTYPQCLTALMVGEADAVSADGALLSGLARSYGGTYLAVLADPIAKAEHGVLVRAGNTQLAGEVDQALKAMRRDGSWGRAVEALRRDTGFSVDRQLNAAYADHR